MKPGQTMESNANKFSAWYGTTGYYESDARTLDTFQTDQKRSCAMAASSQEFRRSFEATTALKKAQQAKAPKEHKNIAQGDNKVTVLPVLKKTLSQTSYVSSANIKNSLKDFTAEDFKENFMNKAAFRGYEESIDISDTTHVVLATLGDLTTEYILDKVTKMATAAAIFRAVTWKSFEKGVDNILNVLQAETIIGREKMCKFPDPNRVDKGLGSGYQLTTNYREYFRKGGATMKPKIYNPDTNPITKDKSTIIQMPREIRPLHAGTPIFAGHVANYLGHVPRNLSNPKKYDHSLGHARPMQNDLLLTQRGLGCIGGYAGHNPIYWTTENMERTCGLDPRTTQGAAFGPERRIL